MVQLESDYYYRLIWILEEGYLYFHKKYLKTFIDNKIITTLDFFKAGETNLLNIKGIGPKTLEKITDLIKDQITN